MSSKSGLIHFEGMLHPECDSKGWVNGAEKSQAILLLYFDMASGRKRNSKSDPGGEKKKPKEISIRRFIITYLLLTNVFFFFYMYKPGSIRQLLRSS